MSSEGAAFDPGRILGVLTRRRVAAVVIGSYAAVMLGVDVATDGVDVVPASDPANLGRLADALRELRAAIHVAHAMSPVALPTDPRLLAPAGILRLITDAGPLGIVAQPAGSAGYDDLRQRAELRPLARGATIPVASLQDVITSKTAAGRAKDLAVLPQLRAAQQRRRRSRVGPDLTPEPPTPDPPLGMVGRRPQLARLRATIDAAQNGHGQLVVITGAAGIGKSRLAAQMLAEGARRGFQVFSAAADEVQRRRPFGVVIDALGAIDRPGSETAISASLADMVEERCLEGPVVLLFDDLQWADESALVAIYQIAQLALTHPLLMVCVTRSYPIDGSLRALLAALDYRRAHRLELEGLGPDEVVELVTGLAGAPPADSLQAALEQAGGNPFYVTELLVCLAQAGSARLSKLGQLEVASTALEPSLRATVLEQLRFLPDATLGVLRAAAIVGRSFSIAELTMVSPSAVADVAAALDPVRQAGIVVADGGRLAFRHDLIREAIYDDMAPAVRYGLHRHLAARLAAAGAGAERVAAQLMLGAEPGDAEAIQWLQRAAGEAAGSPAIAAELLERALELAAGRVELGRQVVSELVRPLLWTGQASRAAEVCAQALAAEPNLADQPLLWLGLADARLLQGRLDDARRICIQARDACPGLDASDHLHLDAVIALAGVYLGDPQGMESARQLAATAPRSISRGTAQQAVGQWELLRGHADRALALYEEVESVRSPPQLRNRIWQGSGIRVRIWHALALLELDRLDDATEMLEQELAAKLNVPGLPHAFLAACRYHAGRFDQALEECDAAISSAETAGSFVPASAPAIAATIALRRGDLEAAQRLTSDAERIRTTAEAAGDTIVRHARVLVLEATGDRDGAADAAGEALDAYQRLGFTSYMAWHAPDLVRVALAADRPEQADAAVAAAQRAVDQLPVASRRAGQLRAQGLLTGDPATLLAAVDASRAAPRPIDLALSLRDASAALARAGRRDEARPLAIESVQLLAGVGADGDQRGARAQLRAAGLTLGSRARHTRARHGWGSLTEAELRVLRLAAKGRSNPEIARALYLSRRTVGWHLSNVFRKLGLSSRGELVVEVMRHDLG
jgi:ATP/maltotriose-dependent transcriptional regulator MalT